MRALVVVALNEVIKSRLLLQEVRCGVLGGLLLERQVHALVAAILLGVTGLNALDLQTEAQPPDGQLLKPNSALGLAKGTPLSVRIALGKPNSLKTRSNTVKA